MPVISPLRMCDLYGGAIKCAIPSDYFDVSDLREIPDTQEVFAHPHTDQSIIFDLLEYQELPNAEAANLHFQQIAECNDALPHPRIVELAHLNDADMPSVPNFPKIFVLGEQSVAKFNESDSARNIVSIYLALLRLPDFGTDVVITFNCPSEISAASSSAGLEAVAAAAPLNKEIFSQILHSFTIVDYGLFNG